MRKIFTQAILTALFMVFIPSNFCLAIQETERITLSQAIDIASKNNLDIKVSRLNLAVEKNNIKAANRLQNPQLETFYNFGKAGKGNPQQIGISQLIEIAKRGPEKQLAKAQYNLEKENNEYLETDLRMDVREAYTNLLAKKSVLKTMEEQEAFLNKMVKTAQEKFKQKKVDEIDELQAQLLLNQIKTEVNSAKYEVKTALYDFNTIINVPNAFYDTMETSFTKDYMPLLIPSKDTKMPEFSQIAKTALENRNDIKIALAKVEAAKMNLKNITRKRIPDIEINGGYGYQNKSQSDDNTFKHGAFAGINIVNIPVLYSYAPEIKNAELKLEQAKLNYNSVLNKAENNVKKAYEKFLTAQLNLKYYTDDLLNNSEKLIKASRQSYKEDKIDLTTLITMEESYRMIIVAHTYALADYYNAWNSFVREINNENFSIENAEQL